MKDDLDKKEEDYDSSEKNDYSDEETTFILLSHYITKRASPPRTSSILPQGLKGAGHLADVRLAPTEMKLH